MSLYILYRSDRAYLMDAIKKYPDILLYGVGSSGGQGKSYDYATIEREKCSDFVEHLEKYLRKYAPGTEVSVLETKVVPDGKTRSGLSREFSSLRIDNQNRPGFDRS